MTTEAHTADERLPQLPIPDLIDWLLSERSAPGASPSPPTVNLMEALPILYLRPDFRAAVASLTRAFAEILARDEQAAAMFNEISGGVIAPQGGSGQQERIAPIVIYGLCVAGGAAVGWLSDQF